LSESDILDLVDNYENKVKQIKDEVFKLAWYMRGSVQAQDLFWIYTAEDREIISNIVKEHIETTNKTGMPLL